MAKESTYLPLFFATNEGGHWFPWTHGSVTQKQLEMRDPKFVEIANQPVHSFRFSELGTDGPRWDCLNGWTQPIKEFRKPEDDRQT